MHFTGQERIEKIHGFTDWKNPFGPLSLSSTDILVNGFPMDDSEYCYVTAGYLEHNPEMSNPEFPIAFQRPLERLPIDFGMLGKPLFNGPLDDGSVSCINSRKVKTSYVRMVDQAIGHEDSSPYDQVSSWESVAVFFSDCSLVSAKEEREISS